jgi:hypothetical protein
MTKGKVDYDAVRELARAFPEVEESTSYGTAALKVRGKLLARLKEDGETLVLRSDFIERDFLIGAQPATFFFTDHYRDYPWILVRLGSVRRAQLGELLEGAWRRVAPKPLVKSYDARDGSSTAPAKPRRSPRR